jgi:two-component system, OmpR family, sensor histidine kinase BaeS
MSVTAGADGRAGSLRWRLSLTYAGVALLTALVLGGILLVMLQVHFSDREEQHLRAAADQAARDLVSGRDGAQTLDQLVRLSAFGLQTRVQLYDAGGRLIADSGSPGAIKAGTVAAPSGGVPAAQAGQGAQQGQGAQPQPGQPAPQGSTRPSGSGAQARSDKVYERAALSRSPLGVTTIKVSEAPAEGASIMVSVIAAWLVAAAAAVLAAALAGFLISRRIARPVVALAEASERMARGDLGTRADVREWGEIGRLARSFNEMATQVEATVSALQRFVSDAAHQLGTPLTALRADLELAQDAAVSDDERRLVARALTQEQRLEDLGGGLLQLSRLQLSAGASCRQAVDLAPLVAEAADAFASRAEQAEITLEVVVAQPAAVALADPDRLRTALQNLLDNAVKFTPAGGHVEVGVRSESGRALLWVADDGPGIPAADRPRVFERFYRAGATSDAPGSGLGLAIVKAAAEACGGTVRLAESAAGTRIELSVPLAPAASRPS